jgi:glycosyltransferase involved in cell wall biosynthesis
MTGRTDKAPLDVVIIAQNEEANIEHSISSVIGWARQVFVVDAFSTDRTAEIARACGAQVYQHEFVDWAAQRNWALANLPLIEDWTFFLDADEIVTPAFKQALTAKLNCTDSMGLAGISVRFILHFLEKELKHAYGHPPIIRIVRRGRARWVGFGAREYCVLDGDLAQIEIQLLHRDRRGISHWIQKQNQNATRDAIILLGAQNPPSLNSPQQKVDRARRLWLQQAVYNRLPLYVRPFIYFLYRYIIRLGFLDGKAGFIYCFLHGFWYPLLIAAKVDEMRLEDERR